MIPGVVSLDMSEALEHEHALLDQVTRDPEAHNLWLWQTPQCLVVPRKIATKAGFEKVAADMADQGWPVHVRGTGGDVTPQGPGIVNVTHVYARAPRAKLDLAEEYGRLCGPIETALGDGASRGWQPGAFCDGAYNVQWNGSKFAGTAMRFRPCKVDKSRLAVLAHALMLFEPPTADAIDALNRFLGALGEGREIDLAAHTGLPPDLSPGMFTDRLRAAFGG